MENSNNLSNLIGKSKSLWQAGNLDSALQLIEENSNLIELNAEASFFFASLYAESKQIDRANQFFSRATELNPHLSICYFQQCLFNIVHGTGVDLTHNFEHLLSLPENHYLHLFSNGLLNLLNDNEKAAIHCFEQGIIVNNENSSLNGEINTILNLLNSQEQKPHQNIETNSALLDIYNSQY